MVSEGAVPAEGGDMTLVSGEKDAFGHVRLGGIGDRLASEIEARTGKEARAVVLGHIQRGGTPTAFDRWLATRFGLQAIDAVADGDFGTMMALRGTNIVRVPLIEGTGELKLVSPEEYAEARGLLRLTDRLRHGQRSSARSTTSAGGPTADSCSAGGRSGLQRPVDEHVVELLAWGLGRERRVCARAPHSPVSDAGLLGAHVEVAHQHQRAEGRAPGCRTRARSWCLFHQGRNDRWVLTTVTGPDGDAISATTATRGSSRISVGSRRPGTRIGTRTRRAGSRTTCHDATGQPAEQRYPVRRSVEPLGTGGRDPGAPGVPTSAATNRWSTAPIASAATAVRSAQCGPRLIAIHLLQREDVGVQGAHRAQPAGLEINVVVTGERPAVEDVERRDAHRGHQYRPAAAGGSRGSRSFRQGCRWERLPANRPSRQTRRTA